MDKIKAKPESAAIAAKPEQATTQADEIFGFFAGKGSIIADVVSPALSQEEWGDIY